MNNTHKFDAMINDRLDLFKIYVNKKKQHETSSASTKENMCGVMLASLNSERPNHGNMYQNNDNKITIHA